MSGLTVGLVQMRTTADKGSNVAAALRYIDEAADRGANFVGLPELFAYIGADGQREAEPIPGPTCEALCRKARERRIWIHSGSFVEAAENGRYYNTSTVIDPDGERRAQYRKIHLFDVQAPGQERYRESDKTSPGSRGVVFGTPWGRMGLTICYDLRFGELYRLEALAGATLIWCPAAFTLFTGKDHWDVLARARAIDNGVFMACAGQFGTHSDGVRRFFGSSMLVDPWGTVVARASEREGVVVSPVDFDWLRQVRRSVPVLEHLRPDAYRVLESGFPDA